MRTILFALLLLVVVLPRTADAHVAPVDIHVISFTPAKEPDRYIIVFEMVKWHMGGGATPKGKFEVRLRQEPRFCSLETYRECIRILRERITRGPDIRIGLLASKGFQPVPGRRGVFQSVGLGIARSADDRSDERAMIYFIHDDSY